MGKTKTEDVAAANRAISRRGEGLDEAASSLTPGKEQNAAIARTGIDQTGERGGGGSETENALRRATDDKRRTG